MGGESPEKYCDWSDGISTFYVDSGGLVFRHTVDNKHTDREKPKVLLFPLPFPPSLDSTPSGLPARAPSQGLPPDPRSRAHLKTMMPCDPCEQCHCTLTLTRISQRIDEVQSHFKQPFCL